MNGVRLSVLWVFVITVFSLAPCGTAPQTATPRKISQVDRGVIYYKQGLYDQAAAQWNGPVKQGDYRAQHNIGLLWASGLGSAPYNLTEAKG